MKVGRRTHSLDMLSFDHKDYTVMITTHHHRIIVSIEKNGKRVMDEWMTPDQFISLLIACNDEAEQQEAQKWIKK